MIQRKLWAFGIGMVFVLLWLAGAPGAVATSVVRMNLDDLTAQSHAIVYGKIVASRTEWDANHTLIYTVSTVEPWEYLKGQLGSTFELREPGGERDGLRMTVPGVPVFTVGEEVILFVWTSPRGQHQVIGFEQGAFAVQTDARTGRKAVTRSIDLGSAGRAEPGAHPEPLSSRFLPQLFDQIRSAAAKSRKAETAQ